MKQVSYKLLEELANKHDLEFILLHGSQSDNKTHDKSDIDIAIKPKRSLDIIAIQRDLSELYESDRVDISNLINADPLHSYLIAQKGIFLAGDKLLYKQFCRNAFFAYADFIPYLKMEAEFIRERNKRYVTN